MNYKEIEDLINRADEEANKCNYDEAEQIANKALEELTLHPLDERGETENSPSWDERVPNCDRVATLRSNAYLSLANIARLLRNSEQALAYTCTSLDIAEKHNLPKIKPKAWNMFGLVYYSLGSFDKALEYYVQALAVHEDLVEKSAVANVANNIGAVYYSLGSYDKALEHYVKALVTREELGEKLSVAAVTGNIGIVYADIGSYDKALEYYVKALAVHEVLGEKLSIAAVTGNIGIVYYNLGANDKALEYYLKALAMFKELGAKSEVAKVTGNIGVVYDEIDNYEKALEYAEQTLAIHEELGEKSEAAMEMGNIGSVYYSLGAYDKALEYLLKALSVQREFGLKASTAILLGSIGSIYSNQNFTGYNAEQAEAYFLESIALSEEIGAKHDLYSVCKFLADLYKAEKRWEEFALYFEKFYTVEKEVQSEEAQKQAEQVEYRRKIEESERDRQVKLARFQEQEKILHNILPSQIADRMIEGEKTIVDSYESVSVLFADIVGFTKLSQRVTPEQLVAGLDGIFNTFDLLADIYGCEKIKTIGDCYMVVAGLPERCDDHAERLGAMAIDMLKAIEELPAIVEDISITMRIGIHSGSVVAGIIGKNKYAYDLWGDAVNTASRMESHGELGKIHVSEEFKHAVETLHATSLQYATSLQFIPRGDMHIKGKGMMHTYFLTRGTN